MSKPVIIAGPDKGSVQRGAKSYIWRWNSPNSRIVFDSHADADTFIARMRAKGYQVVDDREAFAGNVWN